MGELHRTSPLESQENSPGFRSPEEREANLFAAELLIPGPLLEEIFRFMYETPIFASTISDDLLGGLGGIRGPMTLRNFGQRSPHQRARLIAGNSFVRGIPARSLAEIFGVSITAMAIQLEDSGLVN
jgi:Zn-dependent peptidase ImmA (M78 family)